MSVTRKLLRIVLLCLLFAHAASAQAPESAEAPVPVPEADATAAAAAKTAEEEVPAPADSGGGKQPSSADVAVDAATDAADDPADVGQAAVETATAAAATEAAQDANIAALPEPPPPASPPAVELLSSGERAQLSSYVDGVVTSLRREHRLSALTLAVVKDDALWLAQGYGQADLANDRPVAADQTLFRIGSVSKTFIWTAAMMLVERGRLDLDTDVNSYLKSVRVNEAFGAPVTMRQLMHHRAGFEDSMRLFAVADDDKRSLAELLAEHQPQRVYAPGLRTSYSNWGAALAAQVVEDVSGEPYGDFLQREILDPLGMTATTWTAPGKLDKATQANLATGYKRDSGALDVQGYMQIGAYWPAGGIASTATDMARWMRLHLNGGELDGVRLMRAETHAQMWTRAYDDRPDAADVAHGFQDRQYHGLRLLGHGGGTAAFLTQMVLVPELKLGIFMSQNGSYTRTTINELPELIIDQVHGDSYQPELAVAASEPGILTELNGSYLPNRRVFTSFATVFSLDTIAKVSARADDTVLLKRGDNATQYRRVGKERDLFESADGDRLAFLREGGKVVALADGSGVHSFEKVGILGNPNTLLGAFGVSLLLALTTLLGFWWRLGRGSKYGEGIAAGLAATVSLLSSLCVFGFTTVLILLVVNLSNFDLANLAGNYPSEAMMQTHYAGFAIAGAAAAMLLALLVAWTAKGWGLWRRLHFSIFALALALTAYLLWQWRVFGAPVY